MIRIINPNKLTAQPFFQDLIAYLQTHDHVILRQIKKEFPQVDHLDRSMEEYVRANYILRHHRRYSLNLPLLETVETICLDDQLFVDTDSPVYQDLLALTFETELRNPLNQVRLVETTGIGREELTLSNYFHKLRTAQTLSQKQKQLYAILGDVNPDYALKHITAFLLKFTRKEEVKQKRYDIFVESLVRLGYVERDDQLSYRLKGTFDEENLVFRVDRSLSEHF